MTTNKSRDTQGSQNSLNAEREWSRSGDSAGLASTMNGQAVLDEHEAAQHPVSRYLQDQARDSAVSPQAPKAPYFDSDVAPANLGVTEGMTPRTPGVGHDGGHSATVRDDATTPAARGTDVYPRGQRPVGREQEHPGTVGADTPPADQAGYEGMDVFNDAGNASQYTGSGMSYGKPQYGSELGEQHTHSNPGAPTGPSTEVKKSNRSQRRMPAPTEASNAKAVPGLVFNESNAKLSMGDDSPFQKGLNAGRGR